MCPTKAGVKRDRSDRRRTPCHLPERPPRRQERQGGIAQQERFKRLDLLIGIVPDHPRAEASQHRDEERENDDIRHVEKRMGHRHVPTGILA